MYIDNMSGKQSLIPHEAPHEAPDGTLTRYVIDDDKSNQDYISNIPKYTGYVIPTTLKKVRTASSFKSKYQDLKSFLENLGEYDVSNKWVVAGLLAGSDMLVEGSKYGIFGLLSGAAKAVQSSLNVNITKQILCKKFGNEIVFLINVVESKKPGLNFMFLNKFMIMTPPPSSSIPTEVSLPNAVPTGGFDSPHSRVYSCLVDNDKVTRSDEIKRGINVITTSLSDRPIFVIDPNRVDGKVTVNWFGNKSLDDINVLIEKILLDKSYQSRAINIGGKSRYSKKRVTKRRKTTKHRKSTKRRHRRTTRKTT
jgi:hypothetical protein